MLKQRNGGDLKNLKQKKNFILWEIKMFVYLNILCNYNVIMF